MISEIEERSLNAWPALQHQLYDGWLIGFTGGYTRRANCVNVLYPGKGRVEDKIAWCEEQYISQSLPTIFKITPASQPDRLDGLLEERGYQWEAETEVLYASISSMYHVPEADDTTGILPRDEWLAVYGHITGQSQDKRKCHKAILQAIVPKVCPVVVQDQGITIAVGLGVLERGMVGIYDVYTDPNHRRHGCATRVLSTILSWAKNNGAQGAYLQVMSENQPALELYTKLGFKSCYRYWYRVRNEE